MLVSIFGYVKYDGNLDELENLFHFASLGGMSTLSIDLREDNTELRIGIDDEREEVLDLLVKEGVIKESEKVEALENSVDTLLFHT